MDNKIKELIEENNKLQKESLNLKKQIKTILIIFGTLYFILFLSIFIFISRLDVNSLNGTLENLNKITKQLSEKDLDVNSINTLVKNLSELSTDANNIANKVEDKFESGKDFINNTKDKFIGIFDKDTTEKEIIEETEIKE